MLVQSRKLVCIALAHSNPCTKQRQVSYVAVLIPSLSVRVCTCVVAEAKARKKQRSQKKLDKIKAQATAIANDSEMSELEKSKALQRLYKKQLGNVKPSKVYVVRRKVQKGKTWVQASAKSLKSAKGPAKVLVVDKRMKKDKRGKLNAEKRRRKS
jgi:hypothetical protein